MNNGIRVGAAAFALGVFLTGPQVAGVAAADRGAPDSSEVASGEVSAGEHRQADRRADSPRAGRSVAAPTDGLAEVPTAAGPSSGTASRGKVATLRGRADSRGPAEPIALPDPERTLPDSSAPVAFPASVAKAPRLRVLPEPVSVAPTAMAIPESSALQTAGPVLPTALTASEPAAVASLRSAGDGKGGCCEGAPLADKIASLNTAVVGLFDAAAKWLSALPANPISDVVSGALLLVRRTLFNQVPLVKQSQLVPTLAPKVEGNLEAVDAEGDVLRYEVVNAPKYGSVQIGPDGRYVYTADSSDAPAGYSPSLSPDSFTVRVSDAGFNLLNPFGSRSVETTVQIGAPAGVAVLTYDYRVVNLSRYAVTVVTVDNRALEPTGTAAHEAVMQAKMPPVGTVLTPGQGVNGTITRFDEGIALSPGPGASAAELPQAPYSKLVFQRADRFTLWTVYMAIATAQRPSEVSCDASYCTYPAKSTEVKTILLTDRPGTLNDVYPETPGATELLAGLEAASAELGAETLSVTRAGGDVTVTLTGPCISEYSCGSNFGQVGTLETWIFHGMGVAPAASMSYRQPE